MKAGTLKPPHENQPQLCVRASPEWQKILQLLESPVAQALQLTRLFLFEFDNHSEQSPLFILRAATGEFPQEARVPLDEAALNVLAQMAEAPLAVDVSHPPSELKPLISFITWDRCVLALVVAIQHKERLWGCLAGCSAQRRSFTPVELSTFSLLASCVAVAVENARLRAETASWLSEAMSLQAVSSALVEERSLDAILTIIIDEAIRLLDASDALVLLLEEGGDWFRVCAREGPGLTGLTSGRMSVRDSLNGLVVRTGQPLISNDVLTDSRANHARAELLNVHTVAIVPLKIRHKTIGTIAVHNKRDGYFSQADLEVLCLFANQAAVAIDNAQLFNELLCARSEVQRKAQELQELLVQTINIQEDERRRIAIDIHDRVVSRIVGALYEVETCAQLHQCSENLDEQLQLLKQLLNEAVERTRTSIDNLWPATLDYMGLIPALRELFSHQEKRTGIRHSLRVYGSPYELRPTVRIAAYRIAQEALNNVRQYAAASSVDTTIRFGPKRVRIVIQDDGQGFDLSSVMLAPPRRHIGLIGMRERALSIGGTLRVESVPGKGSQVILEIPISEAKNQEGRDQDNESHSRTDC